MFGKYRADAGTESGELHFSAVVDGEKEEGNRGHHVFESGGGLQAVHFGHGEIKNYQVWRKFLGFLDGIRSVNGLSNGELAMSVEKAAELPTDRLMVVHKQYGSWHRPPPAKDQSCELPNCDCLDAGRRRRTDVGGGPRKASYGGCSAALRQDWRSMLRGYKGAGRFGRASPGVDSTYREATRGDWNTSE